MIGSGSAWPGKIRDLRVLVVEDEDIMQTMIEYALNAISVKRITRAPNGSKALGVLDLADEPFDLIICDWVMPIMDGLTFLRQFRARQYETRFLMLTGKATAGAVGEAIGAGANSYIAKPFEVDDFHRKIKSVMNNPADSYHRRGAR